MRITENFKDKLRIAKDEGYERVYSIVGSYMETDYCVFHDIDELLNDPIGYDYGNQKPHNQKGMWTGHPNTRDANSQDIMFSEVHRLEK